MPDSQDRESPFVFVCYSHRDESAARELVGQFQARSIEVWFDEGIRPGANWRDELSEAIESAGLVLFLLSEASATSKQCFVEIDFALDCGTPILVVEIEDLELPGRLSFRIGSQQHIKFGTGPTSELPRRTIEAATEILQRRPFTRPARVADRRDAPSMGAIAIAVEAARPDSTAQERLLLNGICRYISWTGGAFHSIQSPADEAPIADFVVELDLRLRDGFSLAWQLTETAGRRVLWSQKHSERLDAFASKEARIAEMIAEGVVEEIRRRRRQERHSHHNKSYWDLILEADHYQGIKPAVYANQLKTLESAISLFPDRGAARAAKANILAWGIVNRIHPNREAATREVLDEAGRAVELDGNDPYVLVSCGSAHGRLANYQRAISLCRRALSLAPTIVAKEALARSLSFAGEPDEAIRLFHEIIDTMPAGHVFQYGKLVVALIQADRLTEALRYSTECTTHFPKEYLGWLLHANLLALADDDQAHAALDEAKRLIPNAPLETIFDGIERTYGRTLDVQARLTGGVRRLLDDID